MHWSKGRVVSAVIAAMFVAGIGLGMSCSKRSGDVNAVANPDYVKPIGHVQGKVVDRCSDQAIKDVEVSIAIKGSIKTFTTDDNGMFAFQNLPVNYGMYYGGDCYVVVANFAKYNKNQLKAIEKWNKDEDNVNDQKTFRPYPGTVEGYVCLHYEWVESAKAGSGVVTYTGSGAATIVDGLAGEVILWASKPVGTVEGEAYWGKDKTPAEGVVLNLYGSYGSLEGQAVVGAEGTYSFSMVHECQEYYVAPAKPCYEYSSSGSGSGTYAGEYFDVLATQLSDPEGELAVTNVKCIELDPIPCLDEEAPCLISSTPVEYQDIAEARPTITLTFSELMDETLPVKEEVEIVFAGVKATLTPPSVDFDYAWSTATVTMEGYPTDQQVSVLTLTPTEDLLMGVKYDINVAGGAGNLSYKFQDLAGNQYSPTSPVCQVAEATNGNSLIRFTTNYGGTCPKVTNLAQVPRTANAISQILYPGAGGPTYLDKNSTKAQIQGPVLNTDYWNPAGGDTITEYVSDQAVISWTAPGTVTDPIRVKGYRLYGRVNPLDPWTQLANESTLTMYNSFWPAKDADGALDNTNNLNWINTQLSGAVETLTSDNWGYDKTGRAAQTLQLAVTTVNADGYECPEITSDNSVTLKDNTVPMVVRNTSFSSDMTKWGELATAYFYNTGTSKEMDTITLMSLTYPTAGTLPTAWTPSLLACDYGDLPLGIPILEDVTSTISTGLTFIDTSATPANGICQLTFCPGYYTEPNDASDGTVVQRKMLNAKNVVYLVWDNAYKIDTGDRLSISGEVDIAGNVSADWAHVIDDIPVMIKSAVIDAATDTLTVITTERVLDDSASLPTAPNYSKWMRRGQGATGQIELRGLGGDGATLNLAGQPRLVDADLDGNYNEHFSIVQGLTADVDASTISWKMDDVSYIQGGDFIKMAAMWDDDWTSAARGHASSWDRGRWAYWYGDPSHVGAYAPDANGIGTLDGFVDNIPPRLSGRVNVNSLPIAGNEMPTIAPQSAWHTAATVPIPADAVFTITGLRFTEPIFDSGTGTPAGVDCDNPANYAVTIVDCGSSLLCNSTNDVDDAAISVSCSGTGLGVVCTNSNTRATLTCRTPAAPALRVYQALLQGTSITVSNVTDNATPTRNAILTTGASAHNRIFYVNQVVSGTTTVPAHWERN